MVKESQKATPQVTKILEEKLEKVPEKLRKMPLLRTLSGTLLSSPDVGETPQKNSISEASDLILSLSRLLDQRVFDPYFRSKATQFEIETSTIMTDQKCLKSIDKVLRVTKVVTFLSCPIFLIATMRRLNSRSTPLLACIYGILSLDCLRMSYNCYARNYCAIGLRSIGSDGNVLKIGSTMLDSMKAAVGIKGAEDPYQRFSKGLSWQIVMTNCLSNIIYKKVLNFFAEAK